MSQVGTIKQYHDGATYSLAEIYDESLTEYQTSALASPSTECTTVKTVWFEADGVQYEGGILVPRLMSSSTTSISDISPYITTENTAFEYGLRIPTNLFFDCRSPTTSSQFKYTTSGTVKYYCPVLTIEAWYYIDTSAAESGTGVFMSWGVYYTASGSYTGGFRIGFKYTSDTAEIFPGNSRNTSTYTYVRELDRSVFDAPFHLAYVLGYNLNTSLYINGELYYYNNTVNTTKYTMYTTSWHCFGASVTYVSGQSGVFAVSNVAKAGVLSEYRISIGARYSDNFTPQSFKPKVIPVTANLPIRHNDANCYVPLTTNKANTSTPCLAVRHGSTNYYAVK